MENVSVSAIVFDLDGTLIDSAPDLQHTANGLLRAEGHAPVSLDDAKGFIGSGTPVFIARMRAARGIPDSEQDRLLGAFMARYTSAFEHTRIYPGVIEALTALQNAGHRLAICTNKPKVPADAVLAHFDLAQFFDVVLGGDSLPVRKPDPQPLHHAFLALGATTGVYVGDSEVDAETAQRADVPFFLYSAGYRHKPVGEITHQVAFDDFQTLPALVAEPR